MITGNMEYTAKTVAGQDLSGDVGRVVQKISTLDGLETVQRATDGTTAGAQELVGFVQLGGTSGQLCTIVRGGVINWARAGAAIGPGVVELTCDGTGRLIAAAAGDQVVARYQGSGTAAAGDEITVHVCFYRI